MLTGFTACAKRNGTAGLLLHFTRFPFLLYKGKSLIYCRLGWRYQCQSDVYSRRLFGDSCSNYLKGYKLYSLSFVVNIRINLHGNSNVCGTVKRVKMGKCVLTDIRRDLLNFIRGEKIVLISKLLQKGENYISFLNRKSIGMTWSERKWSTVSNIGGDLCWK